MKQTKELLEAIRKSIEEDSMSFIVGAGFSRNISGKFPLWGELLSPLVEEMYPDSFDRKQFKPLLKSVLEVYKDYFTGGGESDWDIECAEKDVVERELRKFYQVYESWGGHDRFWSCYIPRYYVS